MVSPLRIELNVLGNHVIDLACHLSSDLTGQTSFVKAKLN
jgi:hypothetical protein